MGGSDEGADLSTASVRREVSTSCKRVWESRRGGKRKSNVQRYRTRFGYRSTLTVALSLLWAYSRVGGVVKTVMNEGG